MFDFGHVKSHKDLMKSLQSIIKTADEPARPLALKVIRGNLHTHFTNRIK